MVSPYFGCSHRSDISQQLINRQTITTMRVKVFEQLSTQSQSNPISGPEESHSFLTSRPRAKYFPVLHDQTQSISVISFDHAVLKIRKSYFDLNMTR